jgi:hypothetical protein
MTMPTGHLIEFFVLNVVGRGIGQNESPRHPKPVLFHKEEKTNNSNEKRKTTHIHENRLTQVLYLQESRLEGTYYPKQWRKKMGMQQM